MRRRKKMKTFYNYDVVLTIVEYVFICKECGKRFAVKKEDKKHICGRCGEVYYINLED
jgi:rRNA maturation endonuclease Nob1